MSGFVPYKQRDGYQLNNVPSAHLRNIRRRSLKRGTSYTNIVGKVLADRYEIPFTTSARGRKSFFDGRLSETNTLTLRLPVEIMDAVRSEANTEQITIRSVILNALSDAFGLKRPAPTHVEPGSRPGRRKEN